ncbi:MAG: CotH kinase family protein, partial [Firmicutes bacterium]|nr:CotH kinase family protein [Bacillota bacterium]
LVDWIEIYNSGTTAIDLTGFGLSDQEEDPFRWEFPEITIEPASFLLVYASGKDRSGNNNKNLHTNFKLNVSGETVTLTAPTGGRVDALVTGRLEEGLSAGRYPDGGEGRFFFTQPSPGKKNTGEPHSGKTPEPLFSMRGGFYDESIVLTLAPNTQHQDTVIRYTLDGKEPTATSAVYAAPLTINKTTAVRAKGFVSGLLPSKPVNETYFIDVDTELTVVSILMDPEDLWNTRSGIYVLGYNAAKEFPHLGANYWQAWEKPIHLQLFEANGRLGISADAGIRIAGQYSRAMPQKAFNIFARDQYGSDVLEYPFFPEKTLTTQKAITLRQSGQDGTMSKIRDTLMTSLLSDTDLDYQAYRPAIVYLNGQYWGLYNIRERINEHFIAYNHDVDPLKIDLLQGNKIVRAGDDKHYVAMRDFVATHDMRQEENYAYVQTQMDVENFIDYWVAQVYFANTDTSNIRFWREKSNEGKWRW